MTELLERVISELKTLPSGSQDAIATIILEELEDEQKWDKAFSGSPNVLAQLASKAMADYHRGKTTELDPETL